MIDGIDRGPAAWSGRDDGPGPEHARWWTALSEPAQPTTFSERAQRDEEPTLALIGFCSDEGVRRNGGRVGAAAGPGEIRAALASLSDPGVSPVDLGDVVVADGDLEGGHDRLGRAVAAALDAHDLVVVLGGGHEVAYGTYRGVAASRCARDARHGVFNVDAHFDLRRADRPSSGTPFLQMFDDQRAAGRGFAYAAAGISVANNTRALFDTAAGLGVDVLLDADCAPDACDAFVDAFLARVDVAHLTIDLDAMPASAAPGVSAPAAFGVEVALVRRMVRRLAASGKVAVVEVAELNPAYDVDARTARLAARLVDEAARAVAR